MCDICEILVLYEISILFKETRVVYISGEFTTRLLHVSSSIIRKQVILSFNTTFYVFNMKLFSLNYIV